MLRIFALLVLLHMFRTCHCEENKHAVFVIFGGNGDLAKKYLWKSLFNVYTKFSVEHNQAITFDFLAVGRTEADQGYVQLNKILDSTISCEDWQGAPENEESICNREKAEFSESVEYLSVTTENDHTLLCTEIENKISKSPKAAVKEVILYMAISPGSYEDVLQKFHERCREAANLDVRWKLGLEKPFGLDTASAEQMSNQLFSYFSEEEIYRVDHYLGKPVVQAILPFRMLNPDIEKLLNKDHVERVEIVLKETVGVGDRLDVYNNMGVLRDIHQNHLTELLNLVAMDLPSDLDDTLGISENKERLLRQVESVRRHNSLFGQYREYRSQLAELVDVSNDTSAASLPTFAAVVVNINSPRWRGVPFLLVSGKKLDVRESYIRIVFKNNFVCVSHCAQASLNEEESQLKQIVFHIGYGQLRRPTILVSKAFAEPELPENFQESVDPKLFNSEIAYGANVKHFHAGCVVHNRPAYEAIFNYILSNHRENFVGTRHLLLSWHIWDYLVNVKKTVRIYESTDPKGHLNFVIKERNLEFLHYVEDTVSVEVDKSHGHNEGLHDYLQVSSASFLGRRLVTSTQDHLAFLLAQEIDKVAEIEIQIKGTFHLAVSGGSSYLKVFQMLAQYFANLHWHSIHIWQVDERCVPHHDQHSNFEALDRELLRFVDIPFTNVHAMPVSVGGLLCDSELAGAHAYAETIRQTVPNSQFDLILLGLGTDGHIASLFPSSKVLHLDSNTLVSTHEDGPSDTQRRMTLTLPLINRAKRVAFLVTGKHKSAILSKLESARSVDSFPVLGVNPVNGTITWYIDYEAYTGTQGL